MKIRYLLFFLSMASILAACKDDDEPDDPVIPNEEELITTLNLTFTPDGGGDAVIFSFVDLDGDGGDDPVLTTASLAASTSYSGSIELLNETEDPAEDITEEVAEEDDEHQLFYSASLADVQFAYADTDADGNPVGLMTTVTTGDAGTGTLTVILRHEPDKTASGVANGDVTNAGGETDIEVTFDLVVE